MYKNRYVAKSTTGLVQQMATQYLRHGHWFWLTGTIRGRFENSPELVDAALIKKYGIDISQWQRCRRKDQGKSNLHYIRNKSSGQWWIMATLGKHENFFKDNIRTVKIKGRWDRQVAWEDARETPIRVEGYALSYRLGPDGKYHSHVRIDKDTYPDLKAYFVYLAKHRKADTIIEEFWRLPFEPYAPIRRQLFDILRAVNRVRKPRGFSKIPHSAAIRMKRRMVKPFESPEIPDLLDISNLKSPQQEAT